MNTLLKNVLRIGSFCLVVGWLIALSGCGTPAMIYAGNVRAMTATPRLVAQAPTMSDMPGMDMPTHLPVESGSKPLATADDQFVVAWILFGTPTLAAGTPQPVAARPTATPNITQAAQPTLVATATRPTATLPQSSNTSGDAAKGKAVFNGVGACNVCHDVANGVQIVGPSLKGVAVRAGTRKPGQSAADYLHESIVAPNAFVVQGFAAGIMPQNFGQSLSMQQINDLIAYLMTLK